MILTVGGTTFLQGFLSANGTNDTTINPNPYYGPSGGSVFLTTGALSGNGAITPIVPGSNPMATVMAAADAWP